MCAICDAHKKKVNVELLYNPGVARLHYVVVVILHACTCIWVYNNDTWNYLTECKQINPNSVKK